MEQTMQKVRFRHPLNDTAMDLELPLTIRFRDLTQLLYEKNFLPFKKGGYRFIIDDRLCSGSAELQDYIDPSDERLDIQVHGLLVILI